MATTRKTPAAPAAMPASITLVIGRPDMFALTIDHEFDLAAQTFVRTAVASPNYGIKGDMDDSDWTAHKAVVKADAIGAQHDLLMSLARAQVVKDESGNLVNTLTIVVAQGATNYGRDLFASVTDPDAVLTFITRMRKAINVTVIDCEPLESARVATVPAAIAEHGADII